MSFRSPFPDVVVPDLAVHDFLFGSLTDDERDLVALIDGPTGATTTYGALAAQSEALAGALAARGIGVGDVVAVLCPNVPAFATVLHGILRSGATATTVNVLYTADEIARQLEDAKAVALFTVSAFLPQAVEAADRVGIAPERVVVLDGAEGHPDLRSLLAEGNPAPEVTFDPATHVAVLPYSSGTTGRPKGVMLSHRNLVANVSQVEDSLGIGPGDRAIAVLPFFHIYGLTVLLNLALRTRATLVTMPRFELPEFLRTIADNGVSTLFVAPPIAVALAKHPMVDDYDLSSVEIVLSGAAPLDKALGDAVAARLSCEVRQGYGMSELSPVSHISPQGSDVPLDSVGFTIANMECKLVDPATGEEVEYPTGDGVSAPGELWCSGPNVMLGYLGNEQATADTIDSDGFLHTGDIAVVDGAGHVTIVDRLKELIKYKGYQVPPAELEALLLTHPAIADAAVIGVVDDDGEEIPKAFVVRQPGASLGEDEVIDFVAGRVAPHKKVRRVQFIDVVPKSAAGKILRKDLRAAEVPTT